MSLTAPIEEIDEPDPCPVCGHVWEGIYQCRSCGWGEPEETPVNPGGQGRDCADTEVSD